ncbi:MAG: CRISPR-associated protein Cas4 [Gemmatimonadota bacterium]
MYSEDDLLPLSALQHLLFCERQCALIHVEQLWADNRLTVEGSHLHRRVDEAPGETRGDVRIERGIRMRSLRLGLIGRADVVEFHRAAEGECPFPVEYKRGRPKRDRSDEVQICAQALCLEEMLGVPVAAGALFYGVIRRRTDVLFDDALRARTEDAARRLHELVSTGTTPRAAREPKCDGCSMLDLCMPDPPRAARSAARYLERFLRTDDLPSHTAEEPA